MLYDPVIGQQLTSVTHCVRTALGSLAHGVFDFKLYESQQILIHFWSVFYCVYTPTRVTMHDRKQ